MPGREARIDMMQTPLAMLVLGLAFIAISLALIDGNFERSIGKHIAEEAALFDSRIDATTETLARFSSYIFLREIDTPEVRGLMRRAWLGDEAERDASRAELLERSRPAYELMGEYHYRQLHFHLPDSTSFLRMHSPEKFGDSLVGVRATVEAVNERLAPIIAFEEGRIYNGYRFVYPLVDEAGHWGSVELSFSMNAYLKVLSRLDECVYHFCIHRDVVESTVFEADRSRYADSPVSERFMADREVESTEDCERCAAFFDSIRGRLEALLDTGENGGLVARYQGEPRLLLINRIRNLAGEPVACIVAIKADSAYEHMASDRLIVKSLSALLGLLLTAIALILYRERERLIRMSTTDPLTGLYNRVTVRRALDRELGRLVRYGSPLSVLILDIDDFKSINDRFGHNEGDSVLRRLAELMRQSTRETDCVGRWGGEEFIVVLTDTPYADAMRAAEKIRASVAAAAISAKREITISVGVTGAAPDDSQESVVSRADEAMYRAKRSGKNRVEGSAEGAQPGPGHKLY